MSVRVGIVGVSGYTGAEALRLLLGHPVFEVAALFGSTARPSVTDEHPWARGLCELPIQTAQTDEIINSGVQAVVLATPHETAAQLAPALIEANIRVIDLSAAFRLNDASQYPAWYGFEHPTPQLLDSAVYGLPELDRASDLYDASLVAVPGCYPTASILAAAPLIRSGLVTPSPLVIDAVSGVSGAGRGANRANLLCEVSQRPYNVFRHRHRPEIAQALGLDVPSVVFTPSVGPYERGIVATTHTSLQPGVGVSDLVEVYAKAYEHEPFVRWYGPIEHSTDPVPSVGAVERTNFCDIALAVEGSHVILISAIDNLVKGAAGQGVQCLNAVMGFEETLGLLPDSKSEVGV